MEQILPPKRFSQKRSLPVNQTNNIFFIALGLFPFMSLAVVYLGG
jgi:hypothetical protein